MQRCFRRYEPFHLYISFRASSKSHPSCHRFRNMATNSSTPPVETPIPKLRFADVGINLSDPVFQGNYHDKQVHESDLDDVIQRAIDVGCTKLMITGSDISASTDAVNLARKHPGICYATIGIHPCSATTLAQHAMGTQGALHDLEMLARQAREEGTGVAFGEFGLDYDRLQHADKETQIACFSAQLDLAVELQLPLFLHSRAAAEDFERLLGTRLQSLPRRGLVHSFTGTLEEMQRLVGMGFHIGVNGCSLKTEENLDVVRQIPLDRLQLETDGPWCDMRPSHASAQYVKDAEVQLPKAVKKEKWSKGCMIKGRNEPCTIPLVACVVAAVKGVGVDVVCEAAWRNSVDMFGLGEGGNSGGQTPT